MKTEEESLYPGYTMNISYLGLFQGEGGLYWKPWEADPCPKSRLWSCSISCDLRSLKKSSLVVSSTKVEDATIGCLPYPTPCHTTDMNHLTLVGIFNNNQVFDSLTSANLGTLTTTEVFSDDMLVDASMPRESLEDASKESLRVSGLEEPKGSTCCLMFLHWDASTELSCQK